MKTVLALMPAAFAESNGGRPERLSRQPGFEIGFDSILVFSKFTAQLVQQVRKWLPSNTVAWVKRKRNLRRKRRFANLRSRMIKKHGNFTAKELVTACRMAGVQEGCILFVQCSYDDLLTYKGTPYDLLSGLRELVGPQGTLLMPAYTTNMWNTPCRPFDVLREPTYTGILPELFRREDGVVRSLHPGHSICGLGPHAGELLAGHEECVYADGPDSPFDRIRKLDGAQSVCLGLRPGCHSFVHWVEDIEPEKYPIPMHEGPFDCLPGPAWVNSCGRTIMISRSESGFSPFGKWKYSPRELTSRDSVAASTTTLSSAQRTVSGKRMIKRRDARRSFMATGHHR